MNATGLGRRKNKEEEAAEAFIAGFLISFITAPTRAQCRFIVRDEKFLELTEGAEKAPAVRYIIARRYTDGRLMTARRGKKERGSGEPKCDASA